MRSGRARATQSRRSVEKADGAKPTRSAEREPRRDAEVVGDEMLAADLTSLGPAGVAQDRHVVDKSGRRHVEFTAHKNLIEACGGQRKRRPRLRSKALVEWIQRVMPRGAALQFLTRLSRPST